MSGARCFGFGGLRSILPLLLLMACASIPAETRTMPAGYENYVLPAACADAATGWKSPMPIDYDAVRRASAVLYPTALPASGSAIPFLWFFIREDGGVAETRIWRSSGSEEVDRIAVDSGRRLRWRPATCGGAPVAGWYGHPMAVGGSRFP